MRIMDRTWIWISTGPMPDLKVNPDVSATPNAEITKSAKPIGTDEATEKDKAPHKTLNEKIDLQYKKVQSEAKKLTKRRRELRKEDPLNNGSDSSDDSIDEKTPKRARINGGIKPRKRKNKKNEVFKQADGKSKRLYTCSDSEQDAEGHDPTGNARTRKRAKLSKSKRNFADYIQRGPADGFQSRSLVRPADALLEIPMTGGKQLKYQVPFHREREANEIFAILHLGDNREGLDSEIYQKRYRQIVTHLKEKYNIKGECFISYTDPDGTNLVILDGEDINFISDPSFLLGAGNEKAPPTVSKFAKTAPNASNLTRIRYRNRITMTQARPTNHTTVSPWNVSPVEDLSKFSSLDDFLKTLLKGNNWEHWYPNLLTIKYIATKTVTTRDEPGPEARYDLLEENEFKELKSKPGQTICIEISKSYEGEAVSSPPRDF